MLTEHDRCSIGENASVAADDQFETQTEESEQPLLLERPQVAKLETTVENDLMDAMKDAGD